jgi:hypothetical protein
MRLHADRLSAEIRDGDSSSVQATAYFKAQRGVLGPNHGWRGNDNLSVSLCSIGGLPLLLHDTLLHCRRHHCLPEEYRTRREGSVWRTKRDHIHVASSEPRTATFGKDRPKQDRNDYDKKRNGPSDDELYGSIPRVAVFCRMDD